MKRCNFSLLEKIYRKGFLLKCTQARICISNDYHKSLIMPFFFSSVRFCHRFIRVIQTGYTCRNERTFIWLQRRRKKERIYTE